jgi:hypothetical protein
MAGDEIKVIIWKRTYEVQKWIKPHKQNIQEVEDRLTVP